MTQNIPISPAPVYQQQLAEVFLVKAHEFVNASERLWRDRKDSPFLFSPTFYCVLHGIELALKSLLAAGGYSKSQLASKTLGHDLGSLLSDALKSSSRLRTQLNVIDQRTIRTGAKSYSRKCFEYPEFRITTAAIGGWFKIAEKILWCADRELRPKA
jgi:hypothetical protein